MSGSCATRWTDRDPDAPGGTMRLKRLRRSLSGASTLRGWRADLSALCAGVLASLALPPLHLVPVLLLAIPWLLTLLDSAPGPAVAARRGWWFGFGLNLVGLYWITEAILIEAARFWWFVPIAVPALAAVMAVFIAFAAGVARCAPAGWRRVFCLAGAWVLADLARQFIATGFPWNPLGSVWEIPGPVGDVLIQPAAWIGVHGLTLATLMLAGSPILSWRWRTAAVAVMAGWVGFGAVRLHAAIPRGPDLTVLLVQGNVAQGQKWDRAFVLRIFDRYLRLTRDAVAAVGDSPAVVVWPETASPFQLATDPAARQAIEDAAEGKPALIGAVRFDPDGRPRNSLFALGAGGTITGIYDKWHLVPFGEYQPDWLPLGIQVVPGGGFQRGPGPVTLHVPGLPPVGPLICYEAIFPAQVVDSGDRPAWLVNVTNDAWFGNSTGPRQHLAAARMRAVEEGLPLVRAANTGISAAFDAHGHELGRIDLQTSGTLAVALPGPLPETVFGRIGLWLPAISGSVALGVGLVARRNAASG
ncbi:MAG TPA: apolipoprotein N-acyltransferase [Acetobacteraceae bacterium]